MTSKQYFVKTFIVVFFIIAFSEIVFTIFTNRNDMTVEHFFKLSAIAFIVATIVGIINYFAKVIFFEGRIKN